MRCKICQIKFTPTQFLQKCCSVEHSIEWLNLNKEKIEQTSIKLNKERRKTLVAKTKSIATLKNDLQVLINKLVRLIDTGYPCISSGRYTGQIHAGHFYSRGSHPELRFNLLNIYAQSSADNNYKSGNLTGYRLGLISVFGQAHFDKVEELVLLPKNKLVLSDIQNAILKTKKILVNFSKDPVVQSIAKRIELREEFNEYIWSKDL